MSDPNTVLVYRYRTFDPETRRFTASTVFATASTIRLGLGVVIPESGKRVPVADVMQGFYNPAPVVP